MKVKGRAFVVAGLQERSSNDNNVAYAGARFNTDGFCIKHDNVRLCKVTNDVGNYTKYKVLQKFCPKCAGQLEAPTKPLQLLDGAALSLSANKNNLKALPPTSDTKQSTPRHKSSSSQERVRGEKGKLYHPPPSTSRRKRSQSNSQPRKYKQLPEIKEDDGPISSTPSKLVHEIIQQITISPPPKRSSSKSSRQPVTSSADFKQQVHDLSGLLHSIHMKDSADRLVSTIDTPTTQPSSSSQPEKEKQVKSYNNIRDDASAKYHFRKSKRDQSSTKNHGEEVKAFKQYLESVPVPSKEERKSCNDRLEGQ